MGILTVSDRAARGEREDLGGPAIRECLAPLQPQVVKYEVVPDEPELISARLRHWADELGLDLIVTTGGTGLSPRDHTPEATLAVVERLVPGLPEAMRRAGGETNPHALLSRGVAGIRRHTLIINLPGSPKGVRECLAVVLPALPHALQVLQGEEGGHEFAP